MARKTATVTVPHAGRDHGKVFHLTEMPCRQADRWATRALSGMVKANVDLPEGAANAGMAGIFVTGLKALLAMPTEVSEPLLDEMMQCVEWQNPQNTAIRRALIDDDIEDVATLFWLRGQLLELHTGFSVAGTLSRLTSILKAAVPATDSTNTSTSPATSAQ